MKCFYCENVPVGICRWCGKCYCEKHGSKGCHECCTKLDSLTTTVYDKKLNPMYFGVFLGLLFWIEVFNGFWKSQYPDLFLPDSGNHINVVLNSWWFPFAIIAVISLFGWLYTKLDDWRKKESCLISLLATIFHFLISIIMGAIISPLIIIIWPFSVAKLIWFMIGGKIESK